MVGWVPVERPISFAGNEEVRMLAERLLREDSKELAAAVPFRR
jgi:hypothetical protein